MRAKQFDNFCLASQSRRLVVSLCVTIYTQWKFIHISFIIIAFVLASLNILIWYKLALITIIYGTFSVFCFVIELRVVVFFHHLPPLDGNTRFCAAFQPQTHTHTSFVYIIACKLVIMTQQHDNDDDNWEASAWKSGRKRGRKCGRKINRKNEREKGAMCNCARTLSHTIATSQYEVDSTIRVISFHFVMM